MTMKLRMGILLLAILLLTGCANRSKAPLAMDVPAPVLASGSSAAADAETQPDRYVNMTITLRRDGETVLERALVSPEETELVREILFDYLAKSAAWEGVEASELESWVALSCDRDGSAERQTYYQYTVDGRPVLQAGETGMYSIMSDGAFEKLTRLAGVGADTAISPGQAETLLAQRLGERDAATGNAYSFGYVGPLVQNGRDYYRFRLSWLVDNSHLSYLTDYLVSLDGDELKEYIPEEPEWLG